MERGVELLPNAKDREIIHTLHRAFTIPFPGVEGRLHPHNWITTRKAFTEAELSKARQTYARLMLALKLKRQTPRVVQQLKKLDNARWACVQMLACLDGDTLRRLV